MSVIGTVAGLLVVLIAILPGVLGELTYRSLAGVSWREKEFQQLFRLLGFSVFGVAFYASTASALSWPSPDYVVPSFYSDTAFQAQALPRLALAYIGHSASATMIGIAVGLLVLGLRRLGADLSQRDAWDQFISTTVIRRWVIVRVTSGESYVGFIDHADISVEPDSRDVILREPYKWNDQTTKYEPTYNQYIFLQGSSIASIAVVHDPARDVRVVPANEVPFEGAIHAE